jgi:putative tryptophan/tyrosine transport system substrate-binding protein
MTNRKSAQPLRRQDHRIRRRELMLLLGGAITAARALRAQQKGMSVIGLLGVASPDPFAPFAAAFHQGLRETGYVEGQNVTIEYRWAEGQYDRLPALAADLVRRKVNVIVTIAAAPALAAKSATSTIPIVFAGVGDPVGFGLVASLARPGGNLTGFSDINVELTPKRLELLSELVPQAKVIALLVNPNNVNTESIIGDVQQTARAKGVEFPILKASTESEIDAAFAALVELHAGALLVGGDTYFFSRREQLVALASRHAVPASYKWREFATAGGLISYGTRFTETFRQAGSYAAKILSGAKPADLPVQQPTTFELVVNLKTANTLGLTVPQSILARADEVIE